LRSFTKSINRSFSCSITPPSSFIDCRLRLI
jgi:hypothetical protein